MEAARHDDLMSGYTVGYGRALGQSRVYGVGSVGLILVISSFWVGSPVLFGLGALLVCAAVYFYPLIETGRPRIGANQYGIFVEGLGLISWRGVREVKLVSIAVRTMMTHELQIHLSQPIARALIADWRRMPWYRLMMHLPWSMTADNVIRIPLTAFARPAEDIHAQFERLWRHYRGRG